MRRYLKLLYPLCALLICQSCGGQESSTNAPPYYEVRLKSYQAGDFPGVGSKSKWDQANVLYKESISLYESGKTWPSIEKCDEATKIYPYDPRYYVSLGIAL